MKAFLAEIKAYHGKEYLNLRELARNVDRKNGHTALTLAAKSGQIKIIEALLSIKECNINAKSVTGSTALIWAVKNRYVEIAKGLIGAGCDTNAQDICGKTALEIAKETENQEIVSLLEEETSHMSMMRVLRYGGGFWKCPGCHPAQAFGLRTSAFRL